MTQGGGARQISLMEVALPSPETAPAPSEPSPAGLRALWLTAFRNHENVELSLDGRPVVLFGANGAGKTNILEAITCLAPGRGLRRASTEDMAQRTANGPGGAWAVSAEVSTAVGESRIGVGQDPRNPTRRITRLNGAAASQADLARLVRIAWLTPAQDRVFAGPRGERLRFYDRLVLGVAPAHGTHAARYEKAMRERGRLLEEGGDPAWLDGLEQEMAMRGAAMAGARVDVMRRLAGEIDARADSAFPKADLDLSGDTEELIEGGADQAEAERALAERLRAARSRDAAAGRALTGPHRTDLVVHHREKAMPAGECSTGEQKALLVGLALAHGAALRAAGDGAASLLLLDEAGAHLDADRRASLMDALAALDAQAWLTGTDESLFEAFGTRAQMIDVSPDGVRSL